MDDFAESEGGTAFKMFEIRFLYPNKMEFMEDRERRKKIRAL